MTFLDALSVTYFYETVINGVYVPESILVNSQEITLKDAIAGKYAGKIQAELPKTRWKT